MTTQQIINFYRTEMKFFKKDLKMFCKLKLSVEDAVYKQKFGHTDGWVKVQKILDKIDDKFDCEAFLNDY